MKKYTFIIAATLIAIGLLSLGLCLKAGLNSVANNGRQVTVRGAAEREVMANRVKWPISFTITGNDLQSLNSKMQKQNLIISNFLKSNGLEDSDIIINPPTVKDRNNEHWNNNRPTERYEISSSITVKTDKVESVRNASFQTGDLIQQGVILNAAKDYDRTTQISYEYTDFQEVKLQMTRESIANAQAAAKEFATNSGSKIGSLITASQGSLSIEDSDSTTPHIQKLRVVCTMTYALE